MDRSVMADLDVSGVLRLKFNRSRVARNGAAPPGAEP